MELYKFSGEIHSRLAFFAGFYFKKARFEEGSVSGKRKLKKQTGKESYAKLNFKVIPRTVHDVPRVSRACSLAKIAKTHSKRMFFGSLNRISRPAWLWNEALFLTEGSRSPADFKNKERTPSRWRLSRMIDILRTTCPALSKFSPSHTRLN